MAARAASTRGFWPLRDVPVVLWLVMLAASTFLHSFVSAPRWLMIHLLLLGAASHAILVWSRHFTDALLHLPVGPADRRTQSARLVLLNLGTAVVITGVLSGTWQVTSAGAAAVTAAVVWHGVDLVGRLRRALPSRFGVTVRYYIAAAAFLPLGAALGAGLSRGFGDPTHEQVRLAHAALNMLGWMGLTVAGTLVTLWPTMLRTRIADGAERRARRALPLLAASVLVIATGAVAGVLPVVVTGVAGYLAGLAVLSGPLVRAARGKPPRDFPTCSVLAGMLWWTGCLAAFGIGLLATPGWPAAADLFGRLTPLLAAGFGAQVLLGALSYLVPVALGGGPAAVRAASTTLNRAGALRVTVINVAMLAWVLPVSSTVRVIASGLALAGFASFLPLLAHAIGASRRAASREQPGPGPVELPVPHPGAGPVERRMALPGAGPTGRGPVQVAAGLAAVALAIATGVAVDVQAGAGSASAAAGVTATGATTTVRVEAAGMRFSPSTITVTAGDRLVVELYNRDAGHVHDLVFDSGAGSGRLEPGESAVVDVGVVGRDLDGWCSVVGHRGMGMVLGVEVATGAGDSRHAPDHDGGPAATNGPGAGFEARDAGLPPLPTSAAPVLHRRTLTVTDRDLEVAPGVRQRLWTFGGTAPGPVLHGRVGDTFEITLINHGTIGHSIDFHAGSLAPAEPTRTIAPGESLVYRFQATKAGIWLYHCSTMPMSAHIANGLFGAVVIEPPDLPPAHRSYVLVQSELYLGEDQGSVDTTKLAAERPDLVAFNGYANQYDHRPLTASAGERVRVWVLDAGPNRPSSFHIVGAQFDTAWSEGAYLLRPGTTGGSQALALAPAQGGFVELTFPEPGHYPFVSHIMIDAERGAHGTFAVGP